MGSASDAARLRAEVAGVARSSWPALGVIALVGAAFVAIMPPGLPYDEPAHWLNVQWWLDHWTMPVIGEPGTSYEAQMGPVAYAVYAVVAWPFRALWGDEAAFYAARALGVTQLIALALILAVAARRALRARRGVATLVVLAVGLNPMLLAVSTSVQNDTVSLVLGASALLVAVARDGRSRAIAAGVLLGLAILTKVTVWPIAIGIAVALAVRRRWSSLAIVAATSLLVSGWWFVRNLALYGDVTGRAAVEAAGYEFPPLDAGPASLARHVVTYLWLPTEYVRNVVVSPTVIDAVVLLLTVIAGVGLALFALRRRRDRRVALASVVTAAVAVVAWVVLVEVTQSVAFRTAYPALIAFYTGLGALAFLGTRRAAIALLAPLAVVGAWFLVSLLRLPPLGPFITF